MIRLATVFSGIGAVEQALKRMEVPHETIFACDNGERMIDIDYDQEMENVKKLSSIKEKREYVDELYKNNSRKTNFVKQSYLANYEIVDGNFFEDVKLLDGTDFKGKVDLFVGGSPCQSFSVIGAKGGFNDTRGTLFYEYARLVKEIEPYKGEKYNKYQEISKTELKYFEKIVDLCKENNIELIAVEFPSIQTWNSDKKERVEQIAKDNNVRFLDLHDVLDEIGIDWSKDTGDEGYHLNISGAEKISDYLGKFLSENYEFENYKNEEVYKSWEEELVKYNEYKNK